MKVAASDGGAVEAAAPAVDASTNIVDAGLEPEVDGASEAGDADANSIGLPESCPAPNDPYWAQVFAPAWGDASVCGVIEAGYVDGYAIVTGQLYCALVVHNPDASFRCPYAICNSQTSWMGRPCGAYDPAYADGAAEPVIGDAGECLLRPDVNFTTGCGQGGRRPEGLGAIAARGASALGAHFAHQAAFEAVSVVAFERLATELGALGAPGELVDPCLEAAHEEAEHAAITAALAARFGGHVTMPQVAASRKRSLVDFAIENAVEGLVHETFAAAVAVHQSRSAGHADIRAAIARIAAEELGHAELSRRIHAWACTRLSVEERSRVADAMRVAIEALGATLAGRTVEASLVGVGGLPDTRRTCTIHDGLRASLWSHEIKALAATSAGEDDAVVATR